MNILGYDVFDPTIVVPEFTADIGKKKNEKVDYAIMVNDKPLILIEAKSHTETLDRHKTQLERYFTVTESKFAILTNGIEYRFYSDLEKPNIMDKNPFLTINLLNLKDRDIKELEKFKAVKYKQVEVVTGVCGNKGYIRNKVGIPAWWYKIIYIPKTNNYVAFLAPNTNTGMSRAKLREYKATLGEIKRVCGF